MSLTDQLPNLTTDQLRALHATLVEASLAAQLNGNWREIFRRARHAHLGRLQRIYALLESSDAETIKRTAEHLTEHLP